MEDDIRVVPPLTMYKGNYKPSFCQKLINHVRKGKSVESFAGTIGVTPATLYKWAEQFEELEEAMEVAKSLSLGFYEDIAIEQSTGDNKGNATTLKFLMTNQHSSVYKDKQVIENDGNVVFQIDTGIRRELEGRTPDSIEAESRVVKDHELL